MRPIDAIRRHYDASDRGDLQAMFADFAEEATFHERSLPAPGIYRGAAEVRGQVFPAIARTYSSFHFVLEALAEAGPQVIAVGWYEAERNGQLHRFRTCHLWTTEGDKITAFEQIADTLAIHLALK